MLYRYKYHFVLRVSLFISIVSFVTIDTDFRDMHACFLDLLDIDCHGDGMIVFQSAHYGRNDSAIAKRCGTYVQHNCDIDVTLKMNRACAGKSSCQLHVNTMTFGDPCGYEEFLKIRYQCVQSKYGFCNY